MTDSPRPLAALLMMLFGLAGLAHSGKASAQALPAPWSVVTGSWDLVPDGNGAIQQTRTSGEALVVDSGTTGFGTSFTVEAQVTLRSAATYGSAGIAFNVQPSGAYNWIGIRKGGELLVYTNNGSGSVNGTYVTIGGDQIGVTHTLKVERDGVLIRAYVDGTLKMTTTQSTLFNGRVGLATLDATARFDGFSASGSTGPVLALADPWAQVTGSWFEADLGSGNYQPLQVKTTGESLALNNAAALGTSFVVEARVTLRSAATYGSAGVAFNVQASGAYNWIGIRKGGELLVYTNNGSGSVNGTYVTIGGDQIGVTHTLKVERDGVLIRAYVDGTLKMTTTQSTLFNGRVGLATLDATAQFDGFSASGATGPVLDLAPPWQQVTGSWFEADLGSGNYQPLQAKTTGESLALKSDVVALGTSFSVEARVTLPSAATYGSAGVAFNVQPSGAYNWVGIRKDGLLLVYTNNGSGSVNGTYVTIGGDQVGVTHTLKVERDGAQIRAYVDGTLKMTTTQSTLFNGGVGLATLDATGQFDAFSVAQPCGDSDGDGASDCDDSCPDDPDIQTGPCAVCGNGVVEGTEACDDGNLAAGCCSATCMFETEGTTCGNAGDGVCDLQDTCNATGACIDRLASAQTICRAAAGACDFVERCNGAGSCPADAKSTSVCRAAAGECDAIETCDGVSDACPEDMPAPEGTPCGDGADDACRNPDECDNAGACLANDETANADGDGALDCADGCPSDAAKTVAGVCGCGFAETDTDLDAVPDCQDTCPVDADPTLADRDGDGLGDVCDPQPGTDGPQCSGVRELETFGTRRVTSSNVNDGFGTRPTEAGGFSDSFGVGAVVAQSHVDGFTNLDAWTAGAGSWTSVDVDGNSWVRQSNASLSGTSAPTLLMRDVVTLPSAFRASVKFVSEPSPGSQAGLMFNYQSPGNYYFVTYISGGFYLYKVVNGVATWLSYGGSLVSPYVADIAIVRDGCLIHLYRAGSLQFSVCDSTHVGGRVGLVTNGTAARFDDFEYVASSAQGAEGAPVGWTAGASGTWRLVDNGAGNMAVEQSLTSATGISAPTLTVDAIADVPSAFSVSAKFISEPTAGSGAVGLMFNYQSPGNFYYVTYVSSNFYLYKVVNGVPTWLSYGGGPMSAPLLADVKVVRDGCLIHIYNAGALKYSVCDPTFEGGRVGLVTMGAAGRFEDFAYTSNSTPSVDGAPAGWTAGGHGTWRLVDNGGGNMAIEQSDMPPTGTTAPTLTLDAVPNAPSAFSVSTRFISEPAGGIGPVGLMFNHQSAGNFYYVTYISSNFYLYKVVNGVPTWLGYGGGPIAAPFLADVKVVRDGCLIHVYSAGALKYSVCDSTYSGGRVGLVTMGGAGRFDDFAYTGHSTPAVDGAPSGWTAAGSGVWRLVDNGEGQMAIEQGYAPPAGVNAPTLTVDAIPNVPSAFSVSARFLSEPTPGTGAVGLMFNYQSAGNFYYVTYLSGQFFLYKVVNGVQAWLSYGGGPMAAPLLADVKVVRDGCHIRVYNAGELKYSACDSTFSGGRVGLVTMGSAGRFDNFAVDCAAPSVCGNGVVEGTETCDDGNAQGGDCCGATCLFEAAGSGCGSSADTACANPDTCDEAGHCLGNDETADADGDGALDCADGCPSDAAKTAPGVCGCGVADLDADHDGFFECPVTVTIHDTTGAQLTGGQVRTESGTQFANGGSGLLELGYPYTRVLVTWQNASFWTPYFTVNGETVVPTIQGENAGGNLFSPIISVTYDTVAAGGGLRVKVILDHAPVSVSLVDQHGVPLPTVDAFGKSWGGSVGIEGYLATDSASGTSVDLALGYWVRFYGKWRNGSVWWYGVPQRDKTLTVHASQSGQAVTVAAGSGQRAVVEFERVSLTVDAVDPAGNPLPDARVGLEGWGYVTSPFQIEVAAGTPDMYYWVRTNAYWPGRFNPTYPYVSVVKSQVARFDGTTQYGWPPANGETVHFVYPPLSVCGDGLVQGSEQCDDGNTASGDCCSATCTFESVTTVCRAAGGTCDVAEICDGVGHCPADAKSTAVCRASAGVCDVAESCDGVNDTCPVTDLKSTAQCRPSAGVCDVAESCDGEADHCPSDAKSTAVCRGKAAECDAAEVCDGVSTACPADEAEPSGVACGDTADTACLNPDLCDGAGSCVADDEDNGSVCSDGNACTRADTCQAGVCTGASPVVCGAADECHEVGTCDPGSGVCSNPEKANGSACGSVDSSECDAADSCQAGTCQANHVAPGTSCGSPDEGACDQPDSCDSNGVCAANHEPSSTVCRAAVGECDVTESCDGEGNCPADAFKPEGLACGSEADTVCDNPDSCDDSGGCQPNREPSGTTCRADAGDCDVAETCDGAGGCPADGFEAAGTACGSGDSDRCDAPDSCDASGMCLTNHAVLDSDGDGTRDCEDGCPSDDHKIAPGACGCGAADDDSDGDDSEDCHDICPGSDDRVDPDGDSVPDGCDACPVDFSNDSDGDGSCDSADFCPRDRYNDADHDGLCADVDACPLDGDNDVDGDGICGNVDACPADPYNDADGDGVCGNVDSCPGGDDSVDFDGDYVADYCDVCPLDIGNDSDGDLTCDSDDLCPLDNPNDTDADGSCDANDLCPFDKFDDYDGDGVCGDVDACPLDVENDADGDGICEVKDNCPTVPNPSQADFDDDRIGDACEPDNDGDGVIDDDDNCPLVANAEQKDWDHDGQGDACDEDQDNDGVNDAADTCPSTPARVVVLPSGCSTDQLCPCLNKWKNHGAYVSCVAHATNALVAANRITTTEKGVIDSEAGRSSCGGKK